MLFDNQINCVFYKHCNNVNVIPNAAVKLRIMCS